MDEPHHQEDAGQPSADRPARHGMAVVGDGPIFMSHLPMFMSPHDYQVLLRVALTSSDSDPQAIYRDDRAAHPGQRLYTFVPDRFVLPDLFPAAGGEPPRSTSFAGSLVRNHFEEPPAHPDPAAEIAADVTVDVLDVVHVHKLDPQADPDTGLQYLLFGSGTELFMAHRISSPPDFDQLLSVAASEHAFSDDDLAHGVAVTVPDRENTVDGRLREGERDVAASALVDGRTVALRLGATVEIYVETADLEMAM